MINTQAELTVENEIISCDKCDKPTVIMKSATKLCGECKRDNFLNFISGEDEDNSKFLFLNIVHIVDDKREEGLDINKIIEYIDSKFTIRLKTGAVLHSKHD